MKAIELHSDATRERSCSECPYEHDHSCIDTVFDDMLELLKEQEPIEPKRTVNEHGQVFSCGKCGTWFEVQHQKYCHECGRAVKWDCHLWEKGKGPEKDD